MKKFRLLLGLLFFAISSFGQVKITSQTANLRAAPGLKENKICTIPKGDIVTILSNSGEQENWTRVSYNGKVGYINSLLLKNKASTSKNNSHKVGQTIIKHYKNSQGNTVQSPTYYDSPPAGATAECNDGTYSFSQNHRGTCSHHGGVKRWLD